MLMLQLWAVVRCQGTSGHCSSLIWFCLSLDSSACVPRVPAISHLRCSQQGKRDSPQEKGRNCPATLLKEGWETVLKIIRVRQPAAAYRGIVLKGLGRSEQMLHLKNVCRHEVRLVTIFCLGGLERPKQLTKNLGKLHVAFCLYSCVEHFVLASWTSKHWGHFQRQQRTEEVCTRLDDRKLASELVNVWLANFGDALYGFACTNQKFPNTSVWTRHSNAAGACGCRFGISNPFDKNSLWTVDTQHFFDLICGDPYQRGSHIKSTQQTGEQASGAPPSLAMTFYSSGPVWLGSTQRDSLLSICLCADRSIDLSFFSNLSIHLPTYLPAYVSILYLSIHRFICLSIYLSIFLYIYLCEYVCMHVLYCIALYCIV